MQLLLKALVIFALTATFQGISEASEKKWWETASFYQIYPRSFKDSNGDGIGDLKGITEQLDYLKEIGITATWLSPIFTSPMADFGYDITNFTEIDPMFGTMEDFEKLMEKANSIGVKIILDFVPNHASDECLWFKLSAANDPYYKDFFVWHPGKMVNGKREPPTNWIGVFRGSQWTWHEGRQEYYLHQFMAKQPDFNFRNPNVFQTMKDILLFWLRKGVAGFRVDAAPFLVEAQDESGNFIDEPRNPAVNDPEDYGYFQHIYCQNRPETFDIIYRFRAILDEFTAEMGGEDRILMTESYAPLDKLMQYYGNDTTDGAQIPFNFVVLEISASANAYEFNEKIQTWLKNMPAGRTANWVMGNHDRKRIGTRFGIDRIDIINTMIFTLPGCSITYYGEEIGMTDVWISWNDTMDPQACQSNPQVYEHLTRDPSRTPLQWNENKNGGFSDGKSTWLPVNDNYKEVNVRRERDIPISHLNVYKQLQQLRAETTMKDGATEVQALNENVLAIKRSLAGQPTFIVLLNLMDNMELIDLDAAFKELSSKLEYVLVTMKSVRRKGDKANSGSIWLMPYDSVVLRTV